MAFNQDHFCPIVSLYICRYKALDMQKIILYSGLDLVEILSHPLFFLYVRGPGEARRQVESETLSGRASGEVRGI